MDFNAFLNFPIYSGKYYLIMGIILIMLAVFKNSEVYNLPKHIKSYEKNRTLKLLFCILVGMVIMGLTAAISLAFIQYNGLFIHEMGFKMLDLGVENKLSIAKSILLFIYSNVAPIWIFMVFQKKYYNLN
ncbi:hypothetical protein [Clostridium sp.]|uniref:hypothetical protein n=1 Tax=Clostridium sp. TaxID=1506 RepID=UPI002FC7382D